MRRASSTEPQVVRTSLLSVILSKIGIANPCSEYERPEFQISLRAYEAAHDNTNANSNPNANQVRDIRVARRHGKRVYLCQCAPGRTFGSRASSELLCCEMVASP